MSGECALCSQLQGVRANDLLSQALDSGRPYTNRTLFRVAGFGCIPSLGGLGTAHVLVCPESHALRLADLAGQSLGFSDYVNSICTRMLDCFGETPLHVFEHGSSSDGARMVCSVEHAHLHIVASAANVWERLESCADWQLTDHGPTDLDGCVGTSEYLYYRNPSGRSYYALPSGATGFESQLIRRVIAQAEGRDEDWNWRIRPRAGEADAVFRALRGDGTLLALENAGARSGSRSALVYSGNT